MSNRLESDCYQTIAATASGVYKEKGSKFLAFAFPVSTEDEVKEYLKKSAKAYFDARHHCFAYRLGAEGLLWRANDDGEPSSAAGKPILGQLLSYNVSDTLIIVVRYFGGVKLGVSGLIHAYRQAAADALQHSKIVPKYAMQGATLIFPYPQMSQVMKCLKDGSADIAGQELGAECRLSFSVRQSLFSPLSQKLSQIDQLVIT